MLNIHTKPAITLSSQFGYVSLLIATAPSTR